MNQDLLDDLGILDTGDDTYCPTAGRAGLDIDPEHLLEALRLGACPRIDGLLRKSHFGQIFRLKSLNMPNIRLF